MAFAADDALAVSPYRFDDEFHGVVYVFGVFRVKFSARIMRMRLIGGHNPQSLSQGCDQALMIHWGWPLHGNWIVRVLE